MQSSIHHIGFIYFLKGGEKMRPLHITEVNQAFLTKKPLIEIAGYNRVLVENHLGIAMYSSTEIQIKVSYGIVCVAGSELCLMNISREYLVIAGCIEGIKICRRRE